MMEFVSCDDDIPNMMGKIIEMFQTTNQPFNHPLVMKSSRTSMVFRDAFSAPWLRTDRSPDDLKAVEDGAGLL